MQIKILLILYFFSFISLKSFCQESLDADANILETIDGIVNDTSHINNINIKAGLLTSEPGKMKKFAREALRLSFSADYPDGIFESYNNIGIAHAYSGDFQEALNVFDSLLNYITNLNLQTALTDYDIKLART